ncbi:MAG: 4Fe-4S binding protein [Candidatus Methanoplasma sp.]|jgi:NAD-dependent dihydropyrimidine dehydrogenase PreA subunit|nr:4Fe-4S binding protein [Candidatus Methanoplasma sp.]
MRIAIDEGRCIGCGQCAEACREGVIEMAGGKARAVRADLCDGMGGCLPSCPSGALSLTGGDAIPMAGAGPAPSGAQWPIQLRLASAGSPFFRGRRLTVAADCTAFSADASRLIEPGGALLIGCPKLDPDQTEKLASILSAGVTGVTVARMDVPCCRGLERMVASAMEMSGSGAPVRVVSVPVGGPAKTA